MNQIQPQHITLSGLLHGRLFRIPQYQRTYSPDGGGAQSKSARLHCYSGRYKSGRIRDVE